MAKKTFWDRYAFLYDSFEKLNAKAYKSMLVNVAALVPQNAITLECAAGTGEISLAMAPNAKSVLCTDLSLPMLKQAQKKAQKAGLTNITFAQRNLLHLPDQNGRFDVVVAANVVHLLDNPAAALAELWRVTKAGGKLIIPTFLTKNSEKAFSILIKIYGLLGFRPKQQFTQASYLQMLNTSGLPSPSVTILPGAISIGFAVFSKP